MKKKEELFVLIKSLTGNEKRYFKMFCGKSGRNDVYLRLFDAINAQEIFDESAIREQFQGEPFLRQLHVTKNYLRHAILKSLRNFHESVSKSAQLNAILQNVEILFNKELYAHCKTELKRAVNMAESYELTSGLVQTKTWERKLAQTLSPNAHATFSELVEEQALEIKKLENANQYWQLAIDISALIPTPLQSAPPNLDLLDNPDNALTLEAKTLHYNGLYLQEIRQRQFDRAEQALRDLIDILEAHDTYLMEDPGLYAGTINNLIGFLIFRKKHDIALNYSRKARQMYEQFTITAENKKLLKRMLRTYNLEMEIYRDTRELDINLPSIEETEAFIKRHRHKVPQDYLLSFWFQLAHIHFLRKDYARSLTWINLLLNTRFRDYKSVFFVQARWLNLLVHFELQNFFVLRYFVDNTRRFIRKQREMQAYESILLKFFVQISNTPLLEYREKFTRLREKLFPENGPDLVSREALNYIDFRDWIQDRSQ